MAAATRATGYDETSMQPTVKATPSPLIAWFRESEGRQVTRSLLLGAPLVVLGDLFVAVAVALDGTGLARQLIILLIGILLTAAGPGLVIWRLRSLWTKDRYVALHADGIRYHGSENHWFTSWDDVEEIVLDDNGLLTLALQDGAVRALPGSFAGTSSKELAETMKTVRRKARFGLYR